MTELEKSSAPVKSLTKRPWSSREQNELAELHARGLSYKELVQATRRPVGSVASMLRRLGLQKSTPRCTRVVVEEKRRMERRRAAQEHAQPLPPPQAIFMNPADKRAGR